MEVAHPRATNYFHTQSGFKIETVSDLQVAVGLRKVREQVEQWRAHNAGPLEVTLLRALAHAWEAESLTSVVGRIYSEMPSESFRRVAVMQLEKIEFRLLVPGRNTEKANEALFTFEMEKIEVQLRHLCEAEVSGFLDLYPTLRYGAGLFNSSPYRDRIVQHLHSRKYDLEVIDVRNGQVGTQIRLWVNGRVNQRLTLPKVPIPVVQAISDECLIQLDS